MLSAQLGPAVSQNPVLNFSFKGGAKGDKVIVTWTDNKGDKRTDEAFRSLATQSTAAQSAVLLLRRSYVKAKLLAAMLAASALPLVAQDAQKEIERYRQLLADGNPG